jgi:hypothetical protein
MKTFQPVSFQTPVSNEKKHKMCQLEREQSGAKEVPALCRLEKIIAQINFSDCLTVTNVVVKLLYLR